MSRLSAVALSFLFASSAWADGPQPSVLPGQPGGDPAPDTAAALDQLISSIQESVRARAAENAAAVAAANKVLMDETEAIKIELRDRVPAMQKQLDKDELQARLRQVDDGIDVHRG